MTFKAVFPDILARDRSGHGHPEASEAVSGCNILILRLDASAADSALLRKLKRDRIDNGKSKNSPGNAGLPMPPLLPEVAPVDPLTAPQAGKPGTGSLRTDGTIR
jgi:hypothetical protein